LQAAKYNTEIKAIDSSNNQIQLCKLKLASILTLKPREAAVFLGFKKDKKHEWTNLYTKVSATLSVNEIDFWRKNIKHISNGPIKYSRFEQYLSIFCRLVLKIMGRKRFLELFEMKSIEEQRSHFDTYLDKKLISGIFKIAFSPLLYKNRGLNKQALIHRKSNMALIFYKRFRDFCTGTPARLNYYLQFYFLGEVLYDEALPFYLNPEGVSHIRNRKNNVMFEVKSIEGEIINSKNMNYQNYALSNLSDWLAEEAMNKILIGIRQKSLCKFKMLLRYIHRNPINHTITNRGLKFYPLENDNLTSIDRFPFYSLVQVETDNQ